MTYCSTTLEYGGVDMTIPLTFLSIKSQFTQIKSQALQHELMNLVNATLFENF